MKKIFSVLLVLILSIVLSIPLFSPNQALAVTATGGTITTVGDYTYHTFTSSGTFAVTVGGSVDYLVVAGGGGGGGVSTSANGAGGGGAGAFRSAAAVTLAEGDFSVVVGGGGGGGVGSNPGAKGGNSSFNGLVSTGGGYGGGQGSVVNGGSGGSGGGGTYQFSGGAGTTGGHNGGNGGLTSGGGGGGAATAGSNGSGATGGAGGSGSSWNGFGPYSVGGRGGNGSGDVNGAGGAANTGNGGGGADGPNSNGGSGGSGRVIIRYLKPPPAAPTIGTPGVLSTTSIRWNFTDNASDETGFKVYDTADALVATCATADLTYCDETDLSVNTQYTRKVVAYNAAGNSTYSSTATIYTLANAPSTPTVSSSGATTANVIVDVNSNPAATEFAIQETGSTNYVNKTTGALQASADWGTYADFGSGSGITVTGLSVNTQYTFKVKARNGDNAETAFGSTAAAYTRAAAPPAPTVAVRAVGSPTVQNMTPLVGSNPAGTTVAIYKEIGTTCDGTGGSYIAADGSDNGATAVWQTVATWGTKGITGLAQDRQYAFCIVARNGDNISTSFGEVGAYNSCVPGISGDHTITQDCSFLSFIDGNNASRKVHGVDAGTGSGQDSNTAKLTLQSGILAVNADETLAVGSIELTGGSIAISTGGEIKVGTPLWMIDADADGMPGATKLYAQNEAPANGRRRNLMSRIIADCDEGVSTTNGCFRRAITLTYSGTTLTNHDVVFTVDTATAIAAGKMQGDCGDIRIRDSDKTTLLTYWIEGGCNTTNTQIWATVPSIPDGGKTIYMDYHGGATANGFQSWSGTFTLMNNASCPAGWTQNADFDSKFPYGSATYGTTGGASSHSHANASCTTGWAAQTVGVYYGSQNSAVSLDAHTHTSLQASINSATGVLPPYLNTVMCKKADLVIPVSFIGMFDASVPSGWTRFSALDSKFPQGATTYGGTGGATTHSHTTNGGFGTGSSSLKVNTEGGDARADQSHTHTSQSGTTATGNNTPPYLDMVFGQKDAEGVASAGLISIVDVLPPLGWTRFSALDNLFPRGASTYGGTGGTTTHTHSVTVSSGSAASQTATGSVSSDNVAATRTHTHSCSVNTDSQSNLPPYASAIYAKRNTPSATTAVGAETYQ